MASGWREKLLDGPVNLADLEKGKGKGRVVRYIPRPSSNSNLARHGSYGIDEDEKEERE